MNFSTSLIILSLLLSILVIVSHATTPESAPSLRGLLELGDDYTDDLNAIDDDDDDLKNDEDDELIEDDDDIIDPHDNIKPIRIGDSHNVTITSDLTLTTIQPTITANGTIYKYQLNHPDATYISVHFRELSLPLNCKIILSEHDGDHPAPTLREQGFHNLGTFWARHVMGDTMEITLSCIKHSIIESAAHFVIDEYVAGYHHGVTASTERDMLEDEDVRRQMTICKSDDRKNAVCYSDVRPVAYLRSRAVARLFINGQFACTGFLVSHSPSLLLTNEHCITSQADADNTDFEFMGEEPTCGSTSGNCMMCDRGRIFDGRRLLKKRFDMDYALIELEGNPALTYGYLHFDLRPTQTLLNTKLYIPQHPLGRAKEIAISDDSSPDNKCHILGTRRSCRPSPRYDHDLTYKCDTEGGSSGSPVIATDSQKVIALHHCGGGCNGGNMGIPGHEVYDEIKEFLNKVTLPPMTLAPMAPTGSPTVAPPTSPPFTNCPEGKVSVKTLIATDMFPRENSWDLKHAAGSSRAGVVAAKGGDDYTPQQLAVEEFCVLDDCYTFTIYDSFSDGMCCNYGDGAYEVRHEGVKVAEGGKFGQSESTTFGTCGGAGDGEEMKLPGELPPGTGAREVLHFNNFENGSWGVFKKGGKNAGRHQGRISHSGKASLVVRGNSDGGDNAGSFIFTEAIDVERFRGLAIAFWFAPKDFQPEDKFFLEYITNDNTSLRQAKKWTNLEDKIWIYEEIEIDVADSDVISVYLRSQAEDQSRQIYIDDVIITGLNPISSPWREVLFNNFDEGEKQEELWGDFEKGGSNAFLRYWNGSRSTVDGSGSVMINRDRGMKSSVYTEPLGVAGYDVLKVSYVFMSRRFVKNDKFHLEYSTDNGKSWSTVETVASDKSMDKNTWYFRETEFTIQGFASISLRFRSSIKGSKGEIYIDHVQVSGYVTDR